MSSSGFTAEALAHAEHCRIETLTLEAEKATDWAMALQQTAEVRLVAVELELLGIHMDTRPHLHAIDYPGDDLTKISLPFRLSDRSPPTTPSASSRYIT